MKIGIIGCGNMGQAFGEKLALEQTLFFYDRNVHKAMHLQEKGYGKAVSLDEIKKCDLLLLAIKPQNLHEMEIIQSKKIVVSLLAGTPLSILRQKFPHSDIIRLMPNLAILYGEGLMGLSSDQEERKNLYEKIFAPLGKIYWIKENQMDAFTSLAGSGPAFVFSLMEAMKEAGKVMGLDGDFAQEIVLQMIKGSIHLLEKSKKPTEELIRKITSPGGTTMAGLQKMEEKAIKEGIIDTFHAACERGKELSSKH